MFSLTSALALLTILSLGAVIVVLIELLVFKKGTRLPDPAHFFGKHALLIGFLVSLSAVLGSLYYSNILGYEPCLLCWYQRIFTWPQMFIFGLALWKKDRNIVDYALLLSLVGIAVSIYHVYIELGGADLLGCQAFEGAVSCSRKYVNEFGFVTIPVMSLTTYALIISAVLAEKKRR